MAKGDMPGIARLIELHEQKSHVIKELIDSEPQALQGDSENCPVLRDAIGQLRPDQLRREHLPQAIAEMREIAAAIENSVDVIMSKAEELMEHEAATDGAIAILEACSFQDLVGQRSTKVKQLLESLEERMHSLVHETDVEDSFEHMDEDELLEERRRKELILHGPQMSGEGVSQDEIDALLGA